MTFHITATNSGGEAVDFHLWDELPSTMRYVSHTDLSARICEHDLFPQGTMAGNAICRYDKANHNEKLMMDVTVIPNEAGTFENSVYLQYTAPQLGHASSRINKTFPITVLPALTK